MSKKYDGKQLRTCKHCHKKVATEDGILENFYSFSCSPCHAWWKKATWWAAGIGAVIVIGTLVLFTWAWFKKCKDNEE
ncbi:hypothetical protein [endosymbiont GvMRE of Glomus versiforme]|uniref:hypothetical protein n=1 Tax=endosymbiont GvMRE of Glomus versiforme TaxID=2039283 RepID=UPI000ED27179|nr:hypothetical protein [endosymbiont GvMRE of Glomus versiforme]RHZ37497.1 hypothetical protein GvMRE_I1g565 [endosymbiont GvMRE of Glomus versiforme]